MPRDHKAEYKAYGGTPEQRKKNDARKKARRLMVKLGKAKPGDGRDVDHKNLDVFDNDPKNLRMLSPKANRSYPRTKTARRKKT